MRRKEITKHHSLAHLLQAALQKTLGKEVHQAGSYVEENKTRYDFTVNDVNQAVQSINQFLTINKYNELVAKGYNLNKIKAYLHNFVLEKIVSKNNF